MEFWSGIGNTVVDVGSYNPILDVDPGTKATAYGDIAVSVKLIKKSAIEVVHASRETDAGRDS
jgi:hypothetical protein